MDEAKDPVGGMENDGKLITSEELKYVFKSGRDYFPAKPYADDGNTDLYSNEALMQREALRSNPGVRGAITKFVSTNFAMSGGGSNKHITKEEYMKVFVQVGTILRPGMDTDQLMEFIRDDFENDSSTKKKTLTNQMKTQQNEDGDSKPNTAAAAEDEQQ